MYNFVLVHGSWHDGSHWDQVIDRLEQSGHVAYGPTLAGHGKDASKDVEHDDCVNTIVDFIVGRDLHDVVLVGHSFGGTVLARVAEEIPERLRRLVFCSAFIPQPGNSLLDEVPPHYRELFSDIAASSTDNTLMLPFPVWRETFIQSVDLAEAERVYATLSPEPFALFTEKLDLRRFYQLDIPKSFINATEDTVLPPGEWGWHPRMSGRLGLYRLVQMPGPHEVMLTDPRGFADKIVEAGRD